MRLAARSSLALLARFNGMALNGLKSWDRQPAQRTCHVGWPDRWQRPVMTVHTQKCLDLYIFKKCLDLAIQCPAKLSLCVCCLLSPSHEKYIDGRCSPLRGLHYVLELQEAVVCRQCVLGAHLREEVVRNRGAPHELGHRVVDIRHRAGRDGRDRLPEARIDGLEF